MYHLVGMQKEKHLHVSLVGIYKQKINIDHLVGIEEKYLLCGIGGNIGPK